MKIWDTARKVAGEKDERENKKVDIGRKKEEKGNGIKCKSPKKTGKKIEK